MPRFAPWIVAPGDEGSASGPTGALPDFLRSASRIAALLVVFMVLNEFIARVFQFPEQAYHGKWLMG